MRIVAQRSVSILQILVPDLHRELERLRQDRRVVVVHRYDLRHLQVASRILIRAHDLHSGLIVCRNCTRTIIRYALLVIPTNGICAIGREATIVVLSLHFLDGIARPHRNPGELLRLATLQRNYRRIHTGINIYLVKVNTIKSYRITLFIIESQCDLEEEVLSSSICAFALDNLLDPQAAGLVLRIRIGQRHIRRRRRCHRHYAIFRDTGRSQVIILDLRNTILTSAELSHGISAHRQVIDGNSFPILDRMGHNPCAGSTIKIDVLAGCILYCKYVLLIALARRRARHSLRYRQAAAFNLFVDELNIVHTARECVAKRGHIDPVPGFCLRILLQIMVLDYMYCCAVLLKGDLRRSIRYFIDILLYCAACQIFCRCHRDLDDIARGIVSNAILCACFLCQQVIMFAFIRRFREGERREIDLLAKVPELLTGIPITAFDVQSLQHKAEHLRTGRRSLDIGARSLHVLLRAQRGIPAAVMALRAEEVPFTRILVKGTARRDPAGTGTAVLRYIAIRAQEQARGAAVDLQVRRFICVEDDVVQYVVFDIRIVSCIAAVAAGVAIDRAQQLARCVIDLHDLLGDLDTVARDVEHDRLSRQLLDLPACRTDSQIRRVNIDGNVVREHRRIDNTARGLDHRLVLVGVRRAPELVHQAADIAGDRSPVGGYCGNGIDPVVTAIHRNILRLQSISFDILRWRVDVGIGGVGACKVDLVRDCADIEGYAAQARSIHIDASGRLLCVRIDGKVRLGMVMANVCIRNHAILSAAAQHVIGIDGSVIVTLGQRDIARDIRRLCVIVGHYFLFPGVADRVILTGSVLQRIAFLNLLPVLDQMERQSLVAAENIAFGTDSPEAYWFSRCLILDHFAPGSAKTGRHFFLVCICSGRSVLGFDLQRNFFGAVRAKSYRRIALNDDRVFFLIAAVQADIRLRLCDISTVILCDARLILPEVEVRDKIVRIVCNVAKGSRKIFALLLVKADTDLIVHGRIIMDRRRQILLRSVHHGEFLISRNLKREYTIRIGIGRHIFSGNERIGNEIALMLQPDAEEIITTQLILFRYTIGIQSGFVLEGIEFHIDVMRMPNIRNLLQRRGEDMGCCVCCFIQLRRSGILIRRDRALAIPLAIIASHDTGKHVVDCRRFIYSNVCDDFRRDGLRTGIVMLHVC